MLGPVVNALTIVVCSLIGCFFIRKIPQRFENIIKQALGISIIFIGIKGALDNQNVLLLIMSLVIGACIGELINIDLLMNKLGDYAEIKLNKKNNLPDSAGVKSRHSFSHGFVSASILFCSGAMAIVGSIESGLQGRYETLFAKSILDGSISLVFGASMGIGVVFSAVPVLLYQGGIALAAIAVRDFLSPQMITEMSAVGSIVIAAIGFNFLGIKEIKVANLIPAVFVPLLWFAFF